MRSGAPHRLARRWPRPGELARSLFAAPVYWPLGAWAVAIADTPSATAAGSYRADRRTSLVIGSLAGVISGLACGLVTGFTAGSAFRITAGYLPWLALGTALGTGLTAGLATALAGQAALVMWSELARTRRRRARVHFLRLLEDAADRHVLRQAGAVYQFRHGALQDLGAVKLDGENVYADPAGHPFCLIRRPRGQRGPRSPQPRDASARSC